jgi:hypothetical protein
MMNRTWLLRKRAHIAVAIALLLGALFAAVAVAATFGDRGTRAAPKSTFSLEEARVFDKYAVYFAGDAVAGLPLVAILRRDDSAEYVSFIYGDCYNPTGDACAPPAEVQSWPACRRHVGLYEGPYSPVPEETAVRGAPGAFFEGGRRLEIQTGKATIVIFGRSRSDVLQIAEALRGVNVATEANVPLPPPGTGALVGAVECGL